MKKRKKENLAEAVNDEEFRESAELASQEELFSDEEDDLTEKEKPILSEGEIKVRRARRTKFAVAAFVLLLGIGVMGNWYYENSDFSANVKPVVSAEDTKTLGEAEFVDGSAQQTGESSYFSEARVNRRKSRDEAIETLQKTVDDKDADSEAKKLAAQKLADISDTISAENKIETLVTAKGINNCVAVISNDKKRVDVIVDVEELSENVILQIKEIAMEQLGCGFKDVTIIQSN